MTNTSPLNVGILLFSLLRNSEYYIYHSRNTIFGQVGIFYNEGDNINWHAVVNLAVAGAVK